MQNSASPDRADLLLGIEGGATHTVALLATLDLRLVARQELGPGNLQLLSDRDLRDLFDSITAGRAPLAGIGVGLAGARTASDRQRILQAAARTWPGVPCRASHDLDTALAAATLPPAGRRAAGPAPPARAAILRVLVLSGTGSCCFARSGTGRTARVGGWGHLIGDRGSAYAVALEGLRTVVLTFDRTGRWPALGRQFLRRLAAQGPDDLPAWTARASKSQIAALAPVVFEAAARRDPLARAVIDAAASVLAQDALACARRLTTSDNRVEFVLTGSSLLRQPGFRRRLEHHLRRSWPQARLTPLARESAWGAVALAAEAAEVGLPAAAPDNRPTPPPPLPFIDLGASPTEQRNPRSEHLDRLSVSRAIDLFLAEEDILLHALRRERRAIARACTLVARSLRSGGRLFYVGAGTSGRLGVLDASECPPTFGISPDRVQGIIAGGPDALVTAVEGAEDDAAAGAAALRFRGVGPRDVVVGIAASGRTPFVWGALETARRCQARRVLITFNPGARRLRKPWRPDVIIAANVGPELLTGSTRLKAGTATKLILNLITTLAMVRLGKVVSNLMVDLQPNNAKLRQRALHLVATLTTASDEDARTALTQLDWNVRAAVQRLLRRRPRERFPIPAGTL